LKNIKGFERGWKGETNKERERERTDLNLEDIKGFQGMVRVQEREHACACVCEREGDRRERHRECVCVHLRLENRDLRAR